MCVQKACESRAARLAALDDARSPRVRNSSTNHTSRGSRAGDLGVGETRSRFSEREEGGGTQVRFVTLERSRWRVVLRLSVPAGMDARDRRASVDRANARGKRSTADTTRSFGARRARRRIRRHRTPRVARAGDGRRAVFSDTLFVGCFSRSGTRSRALRGARSRPKRFVSASSPRLTHSSRSYNRPNDAGGSGNPLDALRRARGYPPPDGRDDVHLQEGCARTSREGGAQGERVRPRHRGGRGRSRHRRDRGQRAVRQVQEKRACPRRNPRTRRSNPTRARGLRSRRRPKRLRRPFSSVVASRPPRVPASPNAARALPPSGPARRRALHASRSAGNSGWRARRPVPATRPR